MASNNTLANPMNSSFFALRRMIGTHKKHYCYYYYYYPGNSSPVNFSQAGFTKSDEVSARKLAAGLWQLRFMEVSGSDGRAAFRDGSFMSHSDQLANGNVKTPFPHCHNSGEKFKKTRGLLRRPVTILRSRNGLRCEKFRKKVQDVGGRRVVELHGIIHKRIKTRQEVTKVEFFKQDRGGRGSPPCQQVVNLLIGVSLLLPIFCIIGISASDRSEL